MEVMRAVSDEGREAASRAIRYIRDHDCDFLTVENVVDYSSGLASEADAKVALRDVMGAEWYEAQMAATPGRDVIPGQRFVQLPDGREFAVVSGRRWTRVHEYLSNGQLTARWFVDESTGEAREAEGARKPKAWPMRPGAQEFAQWVVELANGTAQVLAPL